MGHTPSFSPRGCGGHQDQSSPSKVGLSSGSCAKARYGEEVEGEGEEGEEGEGEEGEEGEGEGGRGRGGGGGGEEWGWTEQW